MKRFFFSIIAVGIFLLTSIAVFSPSSHAQAIPLEDDCFYDGNFTRPNGNCKSRTPYIHSNLDDYAIQCAVTPQARISRKSCGSPPTTVTLDGDTREYIQVVLNVDFSQAELGGLGPSLPAWQSNGLDNLARVYPYNGLADKPLLINSDTPKEAFRTWWRLLTLRQQIETKAEFLYRFRLQDPPIFDSEFAYIDPAKVPEDTSTTESSNPPYPSNSGPHTAYGHPFPSPLDFFKDSFANKPATFLVPITASTSDLATFRDNTQDATVRIIRIVNITPSISPSQIATYAKNFDSIFSDRNKDYVVFGNELNSLDEYACSSSLVACGNTYANQFSAFHQSFSGNLAVAPTNTSHSERDAAQFISGSISVYGSADFTAHNVYKDVDCPGSYDAQRCNTQSHLWEQSISNTTGKPYIFTEYGLAPNKDTDLNAVLQFITSGPSEPIAITPLVRNVCESTSSEWLIYDGENLRDVDGVVISPDCSTQPFEPTTFRISDLDNILPTCLKQFPLPQGCGISGNNTPEQAYYNLSTEARFMYDAFQPFNFDNVRGYLALQYRSLEAQENNLNNNAGVLAENLSYVQAIKDILGNATGGILSALSPSWLNSARNEALYTSEDYDITYPQTGDLNYKQEEIAVFERLAARARTNELGGNWDADLSNACYNLPGDDPTLPSPLTYAQKLSSPGTSTNTANPNDPSSLDQELLVPLTTEIFNTTPQVEGGDINCIYENGDSCSYNPDAGSCPTLYISKISDDAVPGLREPELPLLSRVGRSIISFTSPKVTDISRLISESVAGSNFSLFAQMLPAFASSSDDYPDEPMFGQGVNYGSDGTSEDKALLSQTEAGSTGKSTAPVRRKGGQLGIDLCKLRNFWLRPAGLQAGEPSDCVDLDTLINAPLNESAIAPPGSFGACEVRQYLFEQSCPGGICYSYILDQANSTSCSSQVLNPYFAAAVALNENGGLTSAEADGSNAQHFGCDPFSSSNTDIISKTSCFTNTIRNDCGKTDEVILKEYGYVIGAAAGAYGGDLPVDAHAINAILHVFGVCSADQATDTQPCFSVWVSPAEAQAAASSLRVILPAQRQTWAAYYQGYLDDFAARSSCTLSTS